MEKSSKVQPYTKTLCFEDLHRIFQDKIQEFLNLGRIFPAPWVQMFTQDKTN